MKITFGLNHKLLERAGYTKVMSHTFGKKYDQEWITNYHWHTNKFPRFHLVKKGEDWFLHFDYYKAGESAHVSEDEGKKVKNEAERLEKLSKTLGFKARLKAKKKV